MAWEWRNRLLLLRKVWVFPGRLLTSHFNAERGLGRLIIARLFNRPVQYGICWMRIRPHLFASDPGFMWQGSRRHHHWCIWSYLSYVGTAWYQKPGDQLLEEGTLMSSFRWDYPGDGKRRPPGQRYYVRENPPGGILSPNGATFWMSLPITS